MRKTSLYRQPLGNPIPIAELITPNQARLLPQSTHGVRIASSVRILGCGGLEIGDDVWVGPDSFIHPTANTTIKIGNHVDIGHCVKIFTGTHDIGQGEHAAGKGRGLDVKIGNGSWLCAGCMILPGVELPTKTIVAAGSVVNKNPAARFSLVAGIPAVQKKVYAVEDIVAS